MPNMPDAVVLCGGAGTRLRSVTGDSPKVMASVGGRPFLELLLHQLHRNGLRRVILAAGYRWEAIQSHFGCDAFGLSLVYSVETTPLGTGGALRNAVDVIESDDVLVMNGDSYADVDLPRFVAAHRESNADASMVVIPNDGRSDSGSIVVDPTGRVICFAEKEAAADARYNNAGVYLIRRALLQELAAGVALSVERGVFPTWIEQDRRIGAFIYTGPCLDIGTPERFQAAQDLLAAEVETVGRGDSQS